jgi:hypothetical protein
MPPVICKFAPSRQVETEPKFSSGKTSKSPMYAYLLRLIILPVVPTKIKDTDNSVGDFIFHGVLYKLFEIPI